MKSGSLRGGTVDDGTRGYQEIGRYSDGTRGWYSRSSGGWSGDGCRGSFDALPMSGSATRDDTSAFVVWWFKPANLRQGSCTISVYTPTGREFQDVAGDPAFYNVVAGQGDYDRVSGFRIDQVENRGRWLTAGMFPLRDGQIAVQMVTRGQDPKRRAPRRRSGSGHLPGLGSAFSGPHPCRAACSRRASGGA